MSAAYEPVGVCSCHACTCPGCKDCEPVFRPVTAAESAAQVDPWADVAS